MFGRLMAGLIVVGLAIGVWALWPSGDSDTTSTTAPVATPTTVTTATSTTDSTPASTTTTEPTRDLIDTTEEAEAVLRELWFGWFEGIYNQDEERIKEVVASQSQLEAAIRAFGAPFTARPLADDILFVNTEILRSDIQCLVVFAEIDVSEFRGDGAIASSVEVLRSTEGEWRFAASWAHRNDLWEADCDAQLEPLS